MAFSTRDVGIAVQQRFVQQTLDDEYEGDTVAIWLGPQGLNMAEFIELHCSVTNMVFLNRFRERGVITLDIRKKYAKYVKKLEAGAAGHLRSDNMGCVQDITTCYSLTEDGVTFLAGRESEVALNIVLACGGRFSKGKDESSGSNCQKVAAYPGWCDELGPCTDECMFKQMSTIHHATCPAGVQGIATNDRYTTNGTRTRLTSEFHMY